MRMKEENAAMNRIVDKSERKRKVFRFIGNYGTIMGLILMIAIFSILSPRAFPTISNLLNVLNNAALSAIIAGGLTAVVIVGDFDMSIAYIASFAGVFVCGLMVRQGLPVWLAILVTFLSGTAIGLINGLIITKLNMPSTIATIGMGSLVYGLNYAYTNGSPVLTGIPSAFNQITLTRIFGRIPINILYMLAIIAILWIVINRSELGQRIKAVGGNATAARLSGINVDRIKIIAYMISGTCAAITGVLLASVMGTGTSSAGDAYLMSSFAAVFVGSATLKDGEFHIVGTLIGVLITMIGFNGLAILGISSYAQYLFQGAIIIGSVALSSVSRRFAVK